MPGSPQPRSDNSVSDVAAAIRLARKTGALGRVIFLVGAGCSITAGVPGAATIARRMVREVGKLFECGDDDTSDVAFYTALVARKRLSPCPIGDPLVAPSDGTIDWYRVYDDMFRKNYVTPDQVRDLFEDLVEDAGGAINWAHLCLGELVKRGFASTVLTTNFDQLVLSGMARAGVLPVVCDGMESLNRIVGAPRHPQLVELHGSRYTYLLRNRPEEVKAVRDNPQATAAIQALFQHATTFVAVGYGGREDGVMDLLVQAAQAYPDKNLFWVSHSQVSEAIGAKVRDFLATSKNGGVVPGQDADHFFLELCRELGVGAPSAVSSPLAGVAQVIGALTRSEVKDRDIDLEIKAARDLLDRLRCEYERARSSPATDPSKIREARLAGDVAEAYRQAVDIDVSAPAQAGDLHLIEETALAALDYGVQAREQKPLEQAAQWFRVLIDNSSGEIGAVTRWASGLGEALGLLGEKDQNRQTLEAAITARSTAVDSLKRDDAPVDWARAQNALGDALQVLGRIVGDSSLLERAVAAYEHALTEITRESFPLDWASIQNHLGRVLTKLGRQKDSTDMLRRAVDLFRSSLTERTRERMPLEWAITQANIADALQALGEREGSLGALAEAAGHYRQALQVLTPETRPDRHRSTTEALQRAIDQIQRRTGAPT